MRQHILTGAQSGLPLWAWLRDAAALVLVWIRALMRLGGAIAFSIGVLALLLVKAITCAFGHPS